MLLDGSVEGSTCQRFCFVPIMRLGLPLPRAVWPLQIGAIGSLGRLLTMTRAIVAVSTFVLGSLGWYVGEFFGLFAAFVGSMIGTGVGIYYGKRLAESWGA